MKNKLFELGCKMVAASAALSPMIAFGAATQPDLPDVNPDFKGPGGLLQFLCDIAGWIFGFLIVLGVIFILVAAFRYLTARGESEKVGEANQALLFSAVAIAVAVVAKAIPSVISGFLGSGDITQCL